MQPLRISDYARPTGDHANCAVVGGMLTLIGIAVGMSLAQQGDVIQGQMQQDRIPRPASPPSPDLTAILAGEILKLLK